MDYDFYDINKFPKNYGVLIFPISISRTDNGTGQDPKQCLSYIKHFSPSKILEPKVGLNVVYGDFLYLHSEEQARDLKKRIMNLVLKHKITFQKLIKKEHQRFQIQHAFSFGVWNQLYLAYDGDLDSDFRLFKKIYDKDLMFQKYLKDDAEHFGRELTDDQVNFFLEECLMFYLISKKKIFLPNEYIQGREQWVLWCYPGVPMKGQIYTYQKNFLNLNAVENPYQNHSYDLESKKLVDNLKINLDTYNYLY
jgi:hypothetical protein